MARVLGLLHSGLLNPHLYCSFTGYDVYWSPPGGEENARTSGECRDWRRDAGANERSGKLVGTGLHTLGETA